MTVRAPLLPLSLILLAFSLHAADLAGPNAIVPVTGRTTGLVVTNLEAQAVPLALTFYGPDGQRVVTTQTLPGRGTMALDGLPPAPGMIRVSSAHEGARFTARAHIPAVPIDALPSEHVLPVSAGVGIANPWTIPASTILSLHDGEGRQLAQLHRIVPALEVLQIDDVFAAFGVAPAAEMSVRIAAQVGVYAYGDDSGFVPRTRTTPAVAPRCAEPASLSMANEPAEGWIVVLKPETSIESITNALPGDAVTAVYDVLPGFAADLTPQQIAALRCEASVELIEQNR